MSNLLRIVIVAGASLLLAAPVAAQQAPAKHEAKAAAAAAAKKAEPKELNFEGDVVEAQFLRPDQGVADTVLRRKTSSLIHVRGDFVDEILKSAEDL
jgi:uncharacterized protein YcgI (DUF1989 family)